MPEVTCSACGTVFDTEREPSTTGASTDRCPSCGTQADPEVDGGTDATDATTVTAPAGTVRITIEVLPGDAGVE